MIATLIDIAAVILAVSYGMQYICKKSLMSVEKFSDNWFDLRFCRVAFRGIYLLSSVFIVILAALMIMGWIFV